MRNGNFLNSIPSMVNKSTRVSLRIPVLLFVLSLTIVGLKELPPAANSQAVRIQKPAHVVRELKRFEGELILSGFLHRSPFQQTTPGEKTVEQVQKNIQILKGMPASQLQPVMNYISTSLGVKCDFCHVNKDGEWNFAADEKPHKATAREMMQMVLNVNKTTFKGATEVTCYTCHRGRSHPTGMPFPMPAPAAVPGAGPGPGPVSPAPTTTETKPKEQPPTAEQILAKYETALGGPAAIAKLKTRSMKGTFLTSGGVSLGYEIQQVAPEQLFITITTPRQGIIERGFDGSSGWEKSDRGLRDIEGTELYYLRRYPGFFEDIRLKEQFARLAFAGTDKVNEREVYMLRGATADNKRHRLYFDRETGLLVRRVISTPTVLANIPEQIDFEDYREVDGMKLPFTIRITSIDPFFNSTRSFTEIKLNVAVDAAKFRKPTAKPLD